MKKYVHILIILCLIINPLSCDTPKDKGLSKEKLLEMAEKCNKAGKTYFQEFTRSTITPGTRYLWDDPEYHYNSRLNACIAHIRYLESDKYDSGGSRHYNQVVDIFANKIILRGWFTRNVKGDSTKEDIINMQDDIPNYTSIEYYKQKNKLFSE